MTKNTLLHKPGEDNQPKGEYLEVGQRGGAVRNPRQVTIDTGDRLPPLKRKDTAGKRFNL